MQKVVFGYLDPGATERSSKSGNLNDLFMNSSVGP